MSFIFIPGAGGVAWYWHRVLPLLRKAGHDALAVDLPGDDPRAGLDTYADLVVSSIATRNDVTLVAQSMGAFTAALVCARAPTSIRELVFVNAMIPLPGETAGEWWDHTGWLEARQAAAKRGDYSVEFDLDGTSCTTCRRASPRKAHATSGKSPRSRSANRLRSNGGPTYRSMS
jgi:pimeloyl-ACP methyl ester carboxylesterase